MSFIKHIFLKILLRAVCTFVYTTGVFVSFFAQFSKRVSATSSLYTFRNNNLEALILTLILRFSKILLSYYKRNIKEQLLHLSFSVNHTSEINASVETFNIRPLYEILRYVCINQSKVSFIFLGKHFFQKKKKKP